MQLVKVIMVLSWIGTLLSAIHLMQLRNVATFLAVIGCANSSRGHPHCAALGSKVVGIINVIISAISDDARSLKIRPCSLDQTTFNVLTPA